jgi:hypothetical protein
MCPIRYDLAKSCIVIAETAIITAYLNEKMTINNDLSSSHGAARTEE